MLLAQTAPTQLSHTGLQQLRQRLLFLLPGVLVETTALGMFDWHKVHLHIQTQNHQEGGRRRGVPLMRCPPSHALVKGAAVFFSREMEQPPILCRYRDSSGAP